MALETTTTSNKVKNRKVDSDGVDFGQASTDYIGFYGATPLVQPSGANQAALTDNTVGTVSTVLAALTGTYNSTLIVNAIASLAAQGNAIRNALVSLGLIKGSA